MKLEDTVIKMTSENYKERFEAEYQQALIRYYNLCKIIEKINNGTIEFTPMCPMSLIEKQKSIMDEYLHVLIERASCEGIVLDIV